MNRHIACRIMVIRKDGVFWSGKSHLETDRENAEIFRDIDEVLNRVRDIIMLGVEPVTQVRIIGEDFGE